MEKRLAIQPGTLGYPDVDTYRDLYFVLEEARSFVEQEERVGRED